MINKNKYASQNKLKNTKKRNIKNLNIKKTNKKIKKIRSKNRIRKNYKDKVKNKKNSVSLKKKYKGGADKKNSELLDKVSKSATNNSGIGSQNLAANIRNNAAGAANNFIGNLLNSVGVGQIVNSLTKQTEAIEKREQMIEETEENRRELEEEAKELTVSENNIKKSFEAKDQIDEMKQTFFKSLGNRVRDMYTGGLTSAVTTLAGYPKEVAETEEDIRRLATQKQCDATFIAGLDKLLNTCSKQEAISVYNEIVQKLKNKKGFFGLDIQKDIDDIKYLDITDDKRREAKIKGIVLNEMSNNKIQELKSEINEELGIKKDKDVSSFREEPNDSKLTKIKKKLKKKLKIVDSEPKESEV